MDLDFSNLRNVAIVAIFVLGLLIIPIVHAGFKIGEPNSFISKIYGPDQNISGWINISLGDEPMDSVFEGIFYDEDNEEVNKSDIVLEDLLELNPSFDYSCVPSDCGTSYTASNGQTQKEFALNVGQSKLIGFELSGKISSINSVNFEIESDAGVSCESQLKIDFLNNENIDFINNKTHPSGVCSPKSYGCFDSSKSTSEFNLDSEDVYCQRINLTQNPGFRIGAWVKHVSGSSNIKMALYNINGVEKETCTLPKVTSSTGQEYFCSINYLVLKPEEHFICIYSTEGDGSYKVRGYPDSTNACGFYGGPIKEETAAYQILAQGRQFNSFGTLKVSDNLPYDYEKLSNKIWNYLIQRYGITGGKIDCSSPQGCVVPINLISSVNQEIVLKNLELKYSTEAGPTTENRFYDIKESPPLITSEPEYQRLFLDNAGFQVPGEFGNYTFNLTLGKTNVISQEIEIKNVPIIESLTPLSTAAGFPTDFEVEVSVPKNVSLVNYNWDFGDNQERTTSTNSVTYIYPEIKNYKMKVTVTDTRGFSSSRTFEISAVSPKDLINSTLDKMDKNLKNINEFTATLSSFHREAINSVLKTENMDSNLEELKQQFDAATNESHYMDMVGDILNLKIPEKIFKTVKASSLIFFSEKDFIEMSIVEAIAGGEYNPKKREDYQNAVIAWQMKNLDAEMDFNRFSVEHNSRIESLVNIFEFKITEKKDINYDYYFIVPRLRDMGFEGNFKEQGNYLYVNLRETLRANFYTTENVDFESPPSFISPPINKLVLEETIPAPPEEKEKRTIIFVLSLVFLAVITVVIYIILQQWYKKKYENYLFPNKNDLYNIVNYVNNTKKRGLKKDKIIRNLKKSKWNSEQIRYVMKKYEGKRTGMIELPLPKVIDKMKDKKPSHPGSNYHHK